MKRSERQLIFNKYGGRCAYCGIILTKGWHVDELLPVRRLYSEEWCADTRKYKRKNTGSRYPERFNTDNQMPSCASCNINKHSDDIESFRNLIAGFMHHLNELNTQYKIAKRYGLVKEEIKPIVFYFETYGKE